MYFSPVEEYDEKGVVVVKSGDGLYTMNACDLVELEGECILLYTEKEFPVLWRGKSTAQLLMGKTVQAFNLEDLTIVEREENAKKKEDAKEEKKEEEKEEKKADCKEDSEKENAAEDKRELCVGDFVEVICEMDYLGEDSVGKVLAGVGSQKDMYHFDRRDVMVCKETKRVVMQKHGKVTRILWCTGDVWVQLPLSENVFVFTRKNLKKVVEEKKADEEKEKADEDGEKDEKEEKSVAWLEKVLGAIEVLGRDEIVFRADREDGNFKCGILVEKSEDPYTKLVPYLRGALAVQGQYRLKSSLQLSVKATRNEKTNEKETVVLSSSLLVE